MHTDWLHVYKDRYKRAEQRVAATEDGKITRGNIQLGQNRVVCSRDSIQTLTIRLGRGLLVSYLDLIFVRVGVGVEQ